MTIFKPTEAKLPKYSKLDHVEIMTHLNGHRYVITEIWHDDEWEYYYDLNEWPLESNPEPLYNTHEKTLRQIKDRIWEQDQIRTMRNKVKEREKMKRSITLYEIWEKKALENAVWYLGNIQETAEALQNPELSAMAANLQTALENFIEQLESETKMQTIPTANQFYKIFQNIKNTGIKIDDNHYEKKNKIAYFTKDGPIIMDKKTNEYWEMAPSSERVIYHQA